MEQHEFRGMISCAAQSARFRLRLPSSADGPRRAQADGQGDEVRHRGRRRKRNAGSESHPRACPGPCAEPATRHHARIDAGGCRSPRGHGRALRGAPDAPQLPRPEIVVTILNGRQPVGLTASQLISDTRLPLEWSAQRAALGTRAKATSGLRRSLARSLLDLPGAQSETPVPPKLDLETQARRRAKRRLKASLQQRSFARPL